MRGVKVRREKLFDGRQDFWRYWRYDNGLHSENTAEVRDVRVEVDVGKYKRHWVIDGLKSGKPLWTVIKPSFSEARTVAMNWITRGVGTQ